ncbi:hypothetical protein [Pseudooceanicola sp.]|uniref:hypothetical protein n=1 Tax=Pseudooceanicola sp. TaxID=1914328 RepID=UPI003519BA63
MAKELSCAQAVDWWSGERLRVARELEERFPLLLIKINTIIDEMPMRAFVLRKSFNTSQIEPIAKEWIEKEFKRFSSQIEESFESSVLEPTEEQSVGWTAGEFMTTGVAVAFSVAPIAALPFVGGLVVTTGVLFPTASIAVVPAAIVGAGAVALGYGPSVRGWASTRLRENYRMLVHSGLRNRVLGNKSKPEIGSLKGALFAELDQLLSRRLEELNC